MRNFGTSCSEFRHLLTVEQKVQTGTGDRGQPSYSWQTFATVWAKITPGLPPMAGGKKLILARQLIAEATHTVTMRYLEGFTFDMRFNWEAQGRIFNIAYFANELELNYVQDVVCVEQKTGG